MAKNTWLWIAAAGVGVYLWEKSKQDAAAAQTTQQPVDNAPVTSAVPVSVQATPIATQQPVIQTQPVVQNQPVVQQTIAPAAQPTIPTYAAPIVEAVNPVPVVLNQSGNLVSQWSPNVTNQFNKPLISGICDEEGD